MAAPGKMVVVQVSKVGKTELGMSLAGTHLYKKNVFTTHAPLRFDVMKCQMALLLACQNSFLEAEAC